MRVLMIAHVGETLGHLVRGLAIADALSARGIDVELAASPAGEALLAGPERRYRFHPIRWGWSHNACDPEMPSASFSDRVLSSVADVIELLRKRRPDLVVGLPGIVTTQAARALGIPHVSVLHGPYLAPLFGPSRPGSPEHAVTQFAARIFRGPVSLGLRLIARRFGLQELDYDTFLHTEPILVPNPGLPLPERPNLHPVRFIRASYGPPVGLTDARLSRACHVTFGSGNPCDLGDIVAEAARRFGIVVVSTGRARLRNLPRNVLVRASVASASLAGRVAAVVSHGGIGTVGTFAEFGTPQLLVPTELDQATMAAFASRQGLAAAVGLDEWTSAPRLGRRLPAFAAEDLRQALDRLREEPARDLGIVSSGADDIAESLLLDRLALTA